MKKHILFILPHLNPKECGVADYFHHLVIKLTGEFRISIITEKAMRKYAPENIEVYAEFEKWDFSEKELLLNKIMDIDPDIIHIQYTTTLFNSNILVNLLPYFLKNKYPVITTFHDLRGPFLMPKLSPFKIRLIPTMFMFNTSTKCIITNNFDYNRLKKFIFVRNSTIKNKIKFIPVGSSIEKYDKNEIQEDNIKNKYNIDDNTIVLMFFGFISFGKGLEHIIETVKLLKDKGEEVKFFIVGGLPADGSEIFKFLKNKIREFKLENEIIFTGFCENITNYFNISKFVIFPYEEGLTLRRSSFIASIDHSCAIISTRNKTLPNFIKDNKNIILVSYGNIDELASKILETSDDKLKLIRKNANKLSQKFKWKNIVKKHKSLYERIIN